MVMSFRHVEWQGILYVFITFGNENEGHRKIQTATCRICLSLAHLDYKVTSDACGMT